MALNKQEIGRKTNIKYNRNFTRLTAIICIYNFLTFLPDPCLQYHFAFSEDNLIDKNRNSHSAIKQTNVGNCFPTNVMLSALTC